MFNLDRNKPQPFPMQDPWEMWETLREHTIHVHIKDGVWNAEKGDCDYSMPGEGDGQVARVLADELGVTSGNVSAMAARTLIP